MNFITVKKTDEILRRDLLPLRTATRAIENACGCILAESILADRDQPPADRSSMDGIAIPYESWRQGRREFSVQGIQKAGIPAKILRDKTSCFEIMTGALVPEGCDCIVPVELISRSGGMARIDSSVILQKGQFIRRQGEECRSGQILLKKGRILTAADVAVAAAVGKSKVKIYDPLIALTGTGDELVDIASLVKPHLGRRSNTYALQALLKSKGFGQVQRYHLKDSMSQILKRLETIIKQSDIIVLSGGVSMGKYDLVPQALQKLKVKIIFHKVAQKPGKPFLFGLSKTGKPVFGFPGNPVSTLICAVRYLIPYLQKSGGLTADNFYSNINTSIKQNPGLTMFIPVVLKNDFSVRPVSIAGSGDFAGLSAAAGFIEIPAGKGQLVKGQPVKYFPW